jgi:hypothetical protein
LQHRSATKTWRDAMSIRQTLADPKEAFVFFVTVAMVALAAAVAFTLGWILLLQ